MSESSSVPWDEALRSAYLEGRAHAFVLHGAVADFQWSSGSFCSLHSALAALLGRSRDLVVSVDGSGGAERMAVGSAASAGDADVPAGGPAVLFPALRRLLLDPARPCGVIVQQAELLLGSAVEPGARAAVASVRRWLDDPGARQTNNVAVFIVDDLSALSPLLRHHPRLFPIEVGGPMDEVRVAALRGELGDLVAPFDDPTLAHRTAGLSLVEVASLCSRLASCSPEAAARYLAAPSGGVSEPSPSNPPSSDPESSDV